MAGISAFGSPMGYGGQQTGWGMSPYMSPYTGQGIGMTSGIQQQIPQLLQVVPQQLQQLQQLEHQQLQVLQQLLQILPQQLYQLQQAILFMPHQIQQLQGQQLPFSQPSALAGMGIGQTGATSQGFASPFQSTPFFGGQSLLGHPGHVM